MRKEFTVQSEMFIVGGGAAAAVEWSVLKEVRVLEHSIGLRHCGNTVATTRVFVVT